jgi:hypothetical protein
MRVFGCKTLTRNESNFGGIALPRAPSTDQVLLLLDGRQEQPNLTQFALQGRYFALERPLRRRLAREAL